MPKRILVVEGNARATSETMVSLGGTPYAQSYGALLESLSPDVACTAVTPSEDGADCLPDGTTLDDFDGIAWTGSALSCYQDYPEVPNQLAFAEQVLATGKPVFGSCWGLQILTTALGGTVRANPNGREIGIGRDITLTDAGASHPLYAGKAGPFDALQVHLDEVDDLPVGGVVLASNDMSHVQALAVESGGVDFWGVQYHPEFDFRTIAVIMERLKTLLQDEGMAQSDAEVDEWIAQFKALDAPHVLDDSRFADFDLTPVLTDPARRHREIQNWLTAKVLTD